MTRQTFLLITALASFAFGILMFFAPNLAAGFLDIATTPQTVSVLRGMGGLIIGSGAINYLLRNKNRPDILKGLLLTNMLTHLLGLSADIWGIFDGAFTIGRMAPVEITHLFVGIGSLVYFLKLNNRRS